MSRVGGGLLISRPTTKVGIWVTSTFQPTLLPNRLSGSNYPMDGNSATPHLEVGVQKPEVTSQTSPRFQKARTTAGELLKNFWRTSITFDRGPCSFSVLASYLPYPKNGIFFGRSLRRRRRPRNGAFIPDLLGHLLRFNANEDPVGIPASP